MLPAPLGATTDASEDLAALSPLLFKLARLQLRNDAWAEDAVSETTVAALEQSARFQGRSQFRTWVVGILKHKIADQLRRSGREISADARMEAAQMESLDELYRQDGRRHEAPLDWGDPEAALSREQFFVVLQACVDRLPDALGRVFLMREWLEYDTREICTRLGISTTNCHVMLFRARMRLRECLETAWFRVSGDTQARPGTESGPRL